MAKISARGARELARHTTSYGAYLLRSDGRLLYKSTVPGSRWQARGRIRPGTEAEMVQEFRDLMATL